MTSEEVKILKEMFPKCKDSYKLAQAGGYSGVITIEEYDSLTTTVFRGSRIRTWVKHYALRLIAQRKEAE